MESTYFIYARDTHDQINRHSPRLFFVTAKTELSAFIVEFPGKPREFLACAVNVETHRLQEVAILWHYHFLISMPSLAKLASVVSVVKKVFEPLDVTLGNKIRTKQCRKFTRELYIIYSPLLATLESHPLDVQSKKIGGK